MMPCVPAAFAALELTEQRRIERSLPAPNRYELAAKSDPTISSASSGITHPSDEISEGADHARMEGPQADTFTPLTRLIDPRIPA